MQTAVSGVVVAFVGVLTMVGSMPARGAGTARSEEPGGASGGAVGPSRSAGGAAEPASTAATAGAEFTLVILKSGPKSGQGDQDARQKMFAGHMSNIQCLADEKRLLIAGPYAAPRDKAWRGLFVLNTGSVEEARALVATDPAVAAGEFVAEIHPMKCAAGLREVWSLEAAAKATRKPDANPMEGMRKYVIATCEDVDAGLSAASKGGVRVVWCGRFEEEGGGKAGGEEKAGGGAGAPASAGGAADGGTEKAPAAKPAARGVLVLDAVEVEAAKEALGDCGCGLDGWFSTKSLLGLKEEVAK